MIVSFKLAPRKLGPEQVHLTHVMWKVSELKGPPGRITGYYSGDAPRPLWYYYKEEAS